MDTLPASNEVSLWDRIDFNRDLPHWINKFHDAKERYNRLYDRLRELVDVKYRGRPIPEKELRKLLKIENDRR